MDSSKLARAAELEAQARSLREAAYNERPLPDFWRVGQKARFIRDQDFGFQKGTIATIIEVKDAGKPASEYQVFLTSNDSGRTRFWTTPDEVELVI